MWSCLRAFPSMNYSPMTPKSVTPMLFNPLPTNHIQTMNIHGWTTGKARRISLKNKRMRKKKMEKAQFIVDMQNKLEQNAAKQYIAWEWRLNQIREKLAKEKEQQQQKS
eukprot:TRINITY_DN15372_c0_g1_i1.p1 TRINITY_DN15372_c0_g1~~TRINITY_DN15372_c0_g1_i1.p1  ORF type:complete len:109 (-),score=24.79 TRINITY_DN15372_c0_g1_i1:14-340(-)